MKSDAELGTEIRHEILAQTGSRADGLDVQVLRGAVTLSGELQSESEKWSLCDAISGMPGVTEVIDDMTVIPAGLEPLPNADAARPWFPAG